jgi:hypothetical protein
MVVLRGQGKEVEALPVVCSNHAERTALFPIADIVKMLAVAFASLSI